MQRAAKTGFRVGGWLVNPAMGEISRDGETVRLEARAMLLLECLAERVGEVVSIEELLDRVWPGVIVSPDSVYQAVASLRRQLGDDPKQPAYIETVPRLGYRMVATVSALENEDSPNQSIANKIGEDQAGGPAGSGANANGVSQTPTSVRAAPLATQAKITPAWVRFLWVAGAMACVALIAILIYGKIGNNNRSVANAVASLPQKSLAV